MEMKTLDTQIIDSSEFPNSDCNFDLRSELQAQVYKFFKETSQNKIYVISDLSVKDSNKIIIGNVRELSSFGIYFNDQQFELKKDRFILSVTNEDLNSYAAFDAKCTEFEKQSIGKITDLVIEQQKFTAIDSEVYSEIIYKRLPNVTVLNRQFRSIRANTGVVKLETLPGYTSVDVTEILCDKADSFTTMSKGYFEIINYARGVIEQKYSELGGKVVFGFSNNFGKYSNLPVFTKACKYIFISLAIYYGYVKGYKFDISKDMFNLYKVSLSEILSPYNNFASDWLSMIQNPCCAGLAFSNDDYFVCMRKPGLANNSKVQILQSEFTEDGIKSRFDFDSFSGRIYNVSDITIKSLQDVYGVTSNDPATAREALQALNKLCMEFNSFLIEKLKTPLDIPVSFSNLLLFERGGKEYLGYIQNTKISISYLVNYMNARMKPFTYEMTNLHTIFDFNAVVDSGDLIEKCKMKGIGEKDLHWQLGDTAKRILVTAIPASAGKIVLENCGDFTLAEVCAGSAIPAQLRGYKTKEPLKFVNCNEAYKRTMLSYFGGVCPTEGCMLNLSPQAWR